MEAPPLLAPFLTHLQQVKRYSPHTLMAYRQDLLQFAEFCTVTCGLQPLTAEADLRALSPSLVRGYAGSLNAARRTLLRKLSALRRFLDYWTKQGVLEANPAGRVVLPKAPKELPVFLREGEVERLFQRLHQATDCTDLQQVRTLAILEVLYGCGLRRQELIELRLPQVNLQEGRMKVRGKGGKERLAFFGPAVRQALGTWLEVARAHGLDPANGPLFQTDKGQALGPRQVYTFVHQALSTLPHLKRKSPHVLRHTFATHLVDHGAELNAVKELLGHSSLAATQVYTHNAAARLKALHKQAHPRG